jgi:hypothetical protein
MLRTVGRRLHLARTAPCQPSPRRAGPKEDRWLQIQPFQWLHTDQKKTPPVSQPVSPLPHEFLPAPPARNHWAAAKKTQLQIRPF